MSNFKASPRQQIIFDTWQNKDLNILIGAVAGSGKTTTLLQLLNLCQYKTLFLAFNKSVQEEIQSKIDARGLKQGKSLTIHSLGLMAIKSKFKRVKVNKGKNFEMVKHLQARNKSIFKKYTWKDKFRITYTIMDMNDISRLFLTEDMNIIAQHFVSMDKVMFQVEDLEELWEDFLEIRNSYYTTQVLEVDFIDMIYIPVDQKIHIPIDPYYLMVDEAQDLNLCQHTLISNLIDQGSIKKWIAVGDRNQCQPKGTKVLMKNMSEKNIEDLVIGDEVISYDINKCQFVGAGKAWNTKCMKVLETNTSVRADSVFTFKLESGHKSSYTSNHKCYVQLSENKMRGKYVVYMMRKGKNYRLGISPCWSITKANAFAPVMRARAEKADDLWILRTFDTRQEAFLHEQILSYKFKIPQLRFIDNSNSNKGLSQDELNIFWHEFKDQEMNAGNILREFNRELDYPLWSNTNTSQGGKGNSWKLSSKTMFKTQACNILPNIMQMCIWDANNVDSKNRIKKTLVNIVDYEVSLELEEFVSLDIEKNHNYVADGILTGNSIYGFSGAYSSSFDMFLDKDNVVELPLDICYRSAKSIIDAANEVYDVMEYSKEEEGIVEELFSADSIKDESMVVCRNSGPLIDLYFVLLGNSRNCYIKGEDILNSILRFAKPYNSSIIATAKAEMGIKMKQLERDKTDRGKYLFFMFKQNYANFGKLVEHLGNDSMTVDTFLNKVKAIFVNKEHSIMLCTIHKSKGLEADVVYILNEYLIPSKFARSKEQLRQEQNLKYVARTRAKKELYYLRL